MDVTVIDEQSIIISFRLIRNGHSTNKKTKQKQKTNKQNTHTALWFSLFLLSYFQITSGDVAKYFAVVVNDTHAAVLSFLQLFKNALCRFSTRDALCWIRAEVQLFHLAKYIAISINIFTGNFIFIQTRSRTTRPQTKRKQTSMRARRYAGGRHTQTDGRMATRASDTYRFVAVVVDCVWMRDYEIEQTALRNDVQQLAFGTNNSDTSRSCVFARRQHDGDVEQRRVGRHLDERRSASEVRQRYAVGHNELIVRAC
jgi:hypothetical protein